MEGVAGMRTKISSTGVSVFPGSLAPGSFLIPHSLALDQANHTLYVADRENGRVQSFNSISGTFLDEIKLPAFGGIVYAVAYNHNIRELYIIYMG